MDDAAAERRQASREKREGRRKRRRKAEPEVSEKVRDAAARMVKRGKEPDEVAAFLVKKGVSPEQATELAEVLDERHQDQLRGMSDVRHAEGGSGTPWRGVLNIGIGVILLMGGLSGELVLKGTDSSGMLVVAALVLIGFGFVRVMQAKKQH